MSPRFSQIAGSQGQTPHLTFNLSPFKDSVCTRRHTWSRTVLPSRLFQLSSHDSSSLKASTHSLVYAGPELKVLFRWCLEKQALVLCPGPQTPTVSSPKHSLTSQVANTRPAG